ncbi:MAG: hypothetical protein KY468_12640 [Armatimonadetes bacterium]|nr:hypothetical protein [Armatimonadota bacterium]
MPQLLQVTTTAHPSFGILTCVGEVDTFSYELLKKAIDGLLDRAARGSASTCPG